MCLVSAARFCTYHSIRGPGGVELVLPRCIDHNAAWLDQNLFNGVDCRLRNREIVLVQLEQKCLLLLWRYLQRLVKPERRQAAARKVDANTRSRDWPLAAPRCVGSTKQRNDASQTGACGRDAKIQATTQRADQLLHLVGRRVRVPRRLPFAASASWRSAAGRTCRRGKVPPRALSISVGAP